MERRVSSIVVILFCALLFGGVAQANDANNWGYLKIDVRLEGKELNRTLEVVKDDLWYPEATDGIDAGYDFEQISFDPDKSGGYILVSNTKLSQEVSANSSRTGKHVKGFYNGTITPGSEPNIVVELSWLWADPDVGRFGDMPLISTKEDANGNNIENDGYRGDIRAEMDYSGPDFASIDFGKLAEGTYEPNTPFLHLRVDFKKLIADLDNKNPYSVNLKDYVIMSKHWLEEGRCLADIYGPNGVPDRIVDYYDIAKMAEQWLQSSLLDSMGCHCESAEGGYASRDTKCEIRGTNNYGARKVSDSWEGTSQPSTLQPKRIP